MILSISLVSLIILHVIAVDGRSSLCIDDGGAKKLLARDFCQVELRSWGYDDSSLVGYAKVNGLKQVNYERPDQNEQVRGFNLNLLRSDCSTPGTKHFDTWLSSEGSDDLAQYLRNLANGSVVYGATCDDATYELTPVARSALLEIGVNVSTLAYRGKLTFVAVIGRPQSAVFKIAAPGGDNLFMEALVINTSGDTSDSHWFLLAVSSLILNAIALIVTTLVIVYVKKRNVGLKMKTHGTPTAAALEYTSLNHRVKCEDSVYKEQSFYDEIQLQQVSSVRKLTDVCNRPAMPVPKDYLDLIAD